MTKPEPGNDEMLPAGHDPMLKVQADRLALDIEQARVEEQDPDEEG